MTRVDTLVFVLSMGFVLSRSLYCLGFCRSKYLYVYSGLIWLPIRGSCLSLSLIGDHI